MNLRSLIVTRSLLVTLLPSIILTSAFAGCGEKASLPANTRIAFSSNRDGQFQIYVMNGDGTGQTRLTTNMATSDGEPAWSPDGTRIAYSGSDGKQTDIYVMNADGSDPKRLTKASTGTTGRPDPAWSPDGTKIAYSGSDGKQTDIYVMNADGSDPKRLTNASTIASDSAGPREPLNAEPSWSPDGTRIAFSGFDGDNNDIYVMNADGSDPKKLTNAPSIASDSDGPLEPSSAKPAWSPDGTRIAFYIYDGDKFDVYVMNADGSDPKKLTNGLHPTWSRDSSQIVFFSRHDGNSDIYVMNADGSGQTWLTNNQADDFQPAICPAYLQ